MQTEYLPQEVLFPKAFNEKQFFCVNRKNCVLLVNVPRGFNPNIFALQGDAELLGHVEDILLVDVGDRHPVEYQR